MNHSCLLGQLIISVTTALLSFTRTSSVDHNCHPCFPLLAPFHDTLLVVTPLENLPTSHDPDLFIDPNSLFLVPNAIRPPPVHAASDRTRVQLIILALLIQNV
jgi:hypothetical protein